MSRAAHCPLPDMDADLTDLTALTLAEARDALRARASSPASN